MLIQQLFCNINRQISYVYKKVANFTKILCCHYFNFVDSVNIDFFLCYI